MNKFFTLAIAFLIFCDNLAFSQVIYYGFSQGVENYTEITGGTVFGSSTSDNEIILNPANPAGGTLVTGVGLPIGFNFLYNGTNFDRIAININGWISLGQSTLTSSVYNNNQSVGKPLSSGFSGSNVLLRNRIAPLACDLMAQSGSEIRMETIGSAPNRICVVQWKNYRKLNGTADNLNFQIKLHETTNTIEFVYGTLSTNNTMGAQIGLGGTTSGDYLNRRTTSDWDNSTVGFNNNSTVAISPTVFPISGKKFIWTAPLNCLPDIDYELNCSVQNVCVTTTPAAITASGFGEGDLQFQWQKSADDGVADPWINVVNGSNPTSWSYTPPIFNGIPMHYRLMIHSCGGASPTFYTSSVLIDNVVAPIESPSNLTFSSVGTASMELNWSKGNGSYSFVVVNTINSFTDPVNGLVGPGVPFTSYTGGEQVIYNEANSTSPSVTVTGLDCNTTYYFKLYEYQRCGTSNYEYFYNTSAASGSQITMQVLTVPMPIENQFTGFIANNLGDVSAGWYEAKSTNNSPTPSEMNSDWAGSTVLGTTAVVNMDGANRKEWIISPKISIDGPTLFSFKAALTDEGSAEADPSAMQETDDKVSVLISIDGCGLIWNPLYVFKESSTLGLSNVLTTYTFSLDNYIGQNIQIAFYAVDGPINNTQDYDFHIGDVQIIETPDCLPPVNPLAVMNTLTSAYISWNAPSEIPVGYEYDVTVDNNPPSGAGSSSVTTNAIEENLLTGQQYYFWVRSVCDGGTFSTWSGPSILTLDYCTPNPSSVDNEGIINVSYGTVNNTTSNEVGNYADYSSMYSSYSMGDSVHVDITLATDNYDYNAYVWVDWNKDGDFNDSTELVFSAVTGIADTNTIQAVFAVPYTSTGEHRMRIGGQDYGSEAWCYDGSYSCFEDYSLLIDCPAQMPMVVAVNDSICAGETANLSVIGIGGATFKWYDAPVNGNLVYTGTVFTITSVSSPISYWVEQSLPNCNPISNRREVKAVIIPVKVILSPVNVSCFGLANGTFTLESVACGTPPFMYSVNGSTFGPIPSNLIAGSHQVVVRDASLNESQVMEISLTQPEELTAPNIPDAIACLGSTNKVINAYPSYSGLLPLDTLVITFNIVQPTEVNVAPGAILATASLSALPISALIHSLVLDLPGTVSASGSSTSEIRLGLSGAINSPAAAGTGSSSSSGNYDYTRQLTTYTSPTFGNVGLRYWNAVDDVPGQDATLGSQATLTIIYQAQDLSTLSWWSAPTGGNLIQSDGTLQTIGTGVIPSPAPQGVYSFYLQTEYGGCASEREEVQVTVINNPQPAIIAPTTVFCPNAGLTLTSSLVTGTLTANSWSNGMTGNNITTNFPGTYTVTHTDLNGCAGTSLPVTIVSYPAPVIDAGEDVEVCWLESATLSASGGINYSWNNNIINGVAFTPSTTKTYTVLGTDVNGCIGSDQVVVTVHMPPSVSGGPDLDICVGDEIVLTGSGAETYTWNNGVTNNVPFVPTSSNIFAVNGVDEFGCANNAFVEVILHNPPVAEIQLVENGSYTTLYASPGNMIYSFQWINCGNNFASPVDTTWKLIPTDIGSYQVAITSNFGCVDTSDCVQVFVVGMEENEMDLGITLYPNPTEGNVYVNMTSTEQANIIVYDAQGKVVSEMSNIQNGTIIDLNNVETGIYVIQVSNTIGTNAFRIVKN